MKHRLRDDSHAQEKRWKRRAKYVCLGVVGVVGVAVVAGVAVIQTTVPANTIPEIITHRLASGRRMPRVIVSLTNGWTGFGVGQVRPDGAPGPHLSPTEFGYRTIVWLGRAMLVIRRTV
jgi:hypothetical protein